MTAPFPHEEVILHPVIGIHADDLETRKHKLLNVEETVELFSGPKGVHTVTVRKLSENVMGKCGICRLITDGQFLEPPAKPKLKIEFVGDSITCGYGIESSEPGLRTEEEDGELTYAFLASQELGAEFSAICVTGCSVTDSPYFPLENRGMDTLYPCCDAPMDRWLGHTGYKLYPFEHEPKDIIVVNLGTNDVHDVGMAGFTAEAHESFCRTYRLLIENIRRLNGPKPFILCTLGPMNHYLWEEILTAVNGHIQDTGDERCAARRLGCMDEMVEGVGADTHPSAMTQARNAKELARILRELVPA